MRFERLDSDIFYQSPFETVLSMPIAPNNIEDRNWTVPVETIDFNNNDDESKKSRDSNEIFEGKFDEEDEESCELKRSSCGLDTQRYIAEMVHILRPSVHRKYKSQNGRPRL